jgi:hypothetical protein
MNWWDELLVVVIRHPMPASCGPAPCVPFSGTFVYQLRGQRWIIDPLARWLELFYKAPQYLVFVGPS